MKKIINFLAILFMNSSLVFAAGFTNGNTLVSNLIEGHLTVTCPPMPTGPATAHAFCQSNILTAGSYSFFEGPKIDADSVNLQATREDGSLSNVQSISYDGVAGKSKKVINLWIRSLLKLPLLGLGRNSIHYVLIKNKNAIHDASFEVTVEGGGKKVCPVAGFYFSQLASDCYNPQNLCSRYFSENNECR
jgi:hypothetical protein